MKIFLDFVAIFSNELKAKGFAKNGLYFRIKQSNNIALIQIQKSVDNTKESVKFTLNVGIHFKSLFLFSSGETIVRPIIDDCQWRLRVGDMMPIKRDYWWIIDEQSNLQLISNELIEIFNSIVYTAIMNNISDELFMKKLLANNITGTTIVGRLAYCTIFLCIYNDDKLPILLEELKNYYEKKKRYDSYNQMLEKIDAWKKKFN